jgi:hypothetical protein
LLRRSSFNSSSARVPRSPAASSGTQRHALGAGPQQHWQPQRRLRAFHGSPSGAALGVMEPDSAAQDLFTRTHMARNHFELPGGPPLSMHQEDEPRIRREVHELESCLIRAECQNQNQTQNQTQRGPTELPRINSASCAPHPPRAAAIAMQEERRHRLASQ